MCNSETDIINANIDTEDLRKCVDNILKESVDNKSDSAYIRIPKVMSDRILRNDPLVDESEVYVKLKSKQSRDCNFQKELTLLITKYRMGEDSNLESYALASYLMACIRAFNFAYQYTNLVEDEDSDA